MTTLAGYLGVAAFIWLAAFQLLLAIGAPMGHMAWGGQNRRLNGTQRAASAAVTLLALFGAWVVGQAAGLAPAVLSTKTLTWSLGGFAVLFGVSLIGNLATSSAAERHHGVPLTLCLSLSCLALALR